MTDTDTSAEAVERECQNIHDAVNRNMIPAYRLTWVDLLRGLLAERDALLAERGFLQAGFNDCNSERIRWRERAGRAEAENALLRRLLVERTLDCLAAEGQAFDAYEEPFSEYGHYGENNPPVGMSSPSDKDYEV